MKERDTIIYTDEARIYRYIPTDEPKHLPRYINEFAGRHNNRPLDTRHRMGGIVRGMNGKRLKYQDLLAE